MYEDTVLMSTGSSGRLSCNKVPDNGGDDSVILILSTLKIYKQRGKR